MRANLPRVSRRALRSLVNVDELALAFHQSFPFSSDSCRSRCMIEDSVRVRKSILTAWGGVKGWSVCMYVCLSGPLGYGMYQFPETPSPPRAVALFQTFAVGLQNRRDRYPFFPEIDQGCCWSIRISFEQELFTRPAVMKNNTRP